MAGSTRIWAGKPEKVTPAQDPWPDIVSPMAPLLLWAAALLAIGLLVVWLSAIAAIATTGGSASLAPTYPASIFGERYPVGVAGEPATGPENAPVTVVEFGDFQCAFCKRFFAEVEQQMLDKYAGKIRFVFRDFPMPEMHPYAETAAEAAHCAGDQRRFWEYHNLLFQSQSLLDRTTLTAYAKQLNLDVKAFEYCMNSGKHRQHVKANLSDGQALGVSGTPTFFINGRRLVGVQPLSVFSIYIDADLAAPSG